MTAEAASHEQVVLDLAADHPFLRTSDLVHRRLPTVVLTRLVAAGKLERVARGVYSLPGRQLSEHRSLAEASLLVPQGVICLLSALRAHDIGTQAPFEVWVAIPNKLATPAVVHPPIRVVRMSGVALHEGIDVRCIDGVSVPIFSAEKTVVDCFKFRNKIGLDVAIEALRDGWSQGRLSMEMLWQYAIIDRVANVMRPYLESVAS